MFLFSLAEHHIIIIAATLLLTTQTLPNLLNSPDSLLATQKVSTHVFPAKWECRSGPFHVSTLPLFLLLELRIKRLAGNSQFAL
jgi:hypothetical protein